MISFEECQEMGRKRKEEEEKRNAEIERIREERLKRSGVNPDVYKQEKPQYDSPYALENSTATVLWIIVAVGGLIFNGGWILSIIATIVWLNYITRHIDVDGGNNNE